MATAKMPERAITDNSNSAREANGKNPGKAKPITKGKMKTKSLALKFAEVFFEGSMKDAIDYMINDVAIPQIKNAVIKGIEVIFYGGASSSSNNRSGGDRVSYTSYYVNRDGSRRPSNSSGSRNSVPEDAISKLKKDYNPRNIVVPDRGEAQRVLADLRRDCNEYGQIGVDRLFELVDMTSDWTSTKYGWVRGDLDEAKVRPCGDGYWFDLPEPILID